MNATEPAHESDGHRHSQPDYANEHDIAADTLVDVLGDECTRQTLTVVTAEPMGGREVADALSVSRATAYRHLNRLRDAGLVDTRMTYDSDGHHHKQFFAVLEEATLSFGSGGLTAEVTVETDPARHRGATVPRDTVADD